ncbi:MAG: MoaD/ThiS family protein [Pontixanthobacter sp.]
MIELRFYGPLAAIIGEEGHIEAEKCSDVATLREVLAKQHSEVSEILQNERTRCFIDDRAVGDDAKLRAGIVVEFLPPVSGG